MPPSEFNFKAFDRSVLFYYNHTEEIIVPAQGRKKASALTVTDYDPDTPLLDTVLLPGPHSPICKQCGLHEHGCARPYMPYQGAERPLVTILFDSVAAGEDNSGELGSAGSPGFLRKLIERNAAKTGVTLADVRWVPLTRCANRLPKKIDFKPRGRWCRHHAIDDLMWHPPRMVIPVGTAALGLLSYKSNAQEWSGRLLTYRGWPDDWLTNPAYALPRVDPRNPDKSLLGHPLFGAPPSWRIPMVPLQAPALIHAQQNPVVYKRWEKSFIRALQMAWEGVTPLNYLCAWYRFTDDVDVIRATLKRLLGYRGIRLTYDTETTGVRPWAPDAAIVSIMLRWTDPETGQPDSIGFPWDYQATDKYPDYETSPLLPYIEELKYPLWQLLTQSDLVGHNITFDMLYTYATFWRKSLFGWSDTKRNRKRDRVMCALADASRWDTWHMAFAREQKRGSLGLDALAYDWVPELAGYEEDMTLLIELHRARMHPAEEQGGHYLNCDRKYWPTHVTSYVMGDVEVCSRAQERLEKALAECEVFQFPLANPEKPGRFRYYEAPSRSWVYQNIMSPAARTLMKIMARGLFINENSLCEMETVLPDKIKKLRDGLKTINPQIEAWCTTQKATNKDWELDLENTGQLKDLLFQTLKLPIKRFTKSGRQQLGDDVELAYNSVRQAVKRAYPDLTPLQLDEQVNAELLPVAAVDKFTLNKLCVDHAYLRPLLEYRKIFKLYSTYVRPLRNLFTEGLDKKKRTHDQHLCFDQCIHASFLLTGTRGGRLSCKDPNLQQLPRDGEVKSMFVSRFGARGCMYQGDLSQIELRLLAAACGDPTMVKAYFDETDLHSLTTSRIFDVPYENFSKDYMKQLQEKGNDKEAKSLEEKRSIGKTVNFLTGYGGGAFGLQNVLAMKSIYKQIEECQDIIDKFFDSYPALRQMLSQYKRFIEDTGVAVSIFGRVRVFEEVYSDDNEAAAKALRAGCNHLIQSTASDMMLVALTEIERRMRAADLESILVSTVHDSLVLDCVRAELSKVHEIVMSVLNNFPGVFASLFGNTFDTSWMIVPFTGDCEVGLNYLNMRKIPKKDMDWDKLLSSKH